MPVSMQLACNNRIKKNSCGFKQQQQKKKEALQQHKKMVRRRFNGDKGETCEQKTLRRKSISSGSRSSTSNEKKGCMVDWRRMEKKKLGEKGLNIVEV